MPSKTSEKHAEKTVIKVTRTESSTVQLKTTFVMLVRNTDIGQNVVFQLNMMNIVQTHPPEGGTQHSPHQDRSLEGKAERGNPTRVMGRNHKRMMRIDLAVTIGIFTHWMNNATMAKTYHNVTTMITHHTRMNSHST